MVLSKKCFYLLERGLLVNPCLIKEYKYCYEKFDCITLCGGYNNSDAAVY